MIDISLIRKTPEIVKQGMKNKGYEAEGLLRKIQQLDDTWRALQTELQEVQTRSNTLSAQIGELFREGKRDEAESIKMESGKLKELLKEKERVVKETAGTLQELLLEVPNLPHKSVPVGSNAQENVVAFEEGQRPEFDFSAKPHWELAEIHGLIDFERGAKVTGAGFPFYIGKGARLQRALINFFLDVAIEQGHYTEIQPPIFVNEDSARGTGQIPDKEAQMYEVPRDQLFAIPTGEVPVTNYHRQEILDHSALPVKYCTYTPCFRREAGSYGKDVRGLNRLHQFDKVELVQLVEAGTSYEALENLCEDAERPLRLLGLPFRRLVLCTGDLGFTQTKTYDLEVWSAGQEKWLEVSSASNFEAFQAQRMHIRYRSPEAKKPLHVHTLNASGLALPRTVAALLEHGQQADGSIVFPEPLHSYLGFDRIG